MRMSKENKTQLLSYLTTEDFELERTAGGFLNCTVDGVKHERIKVYRAFPLTQESEFISLRENTDDAKEIGMIRHLIDLSQEYQDLLNEQLELRYFTPQITEVKKIREENGYSYWDCVTDSGPVRFVMRSGSGSVVNLGKGRYIINDIDGNRFEIKDFNKLSSQERKQLDLYI